MSLICKFATRQSKPEKIERWIAYLEEVQQRSQRPEEQALVQMLRMEARQWLGQP